jgi:16S rRNA (uracil1498-N3)-methyltransferase
VRPLGDWLRGDLPEQRLMLSLASDSAPLMQAISQHPEGLTASPVVLLSGPEGGLSPAEELAARTAGFVPVSLGARTLRAETAPLAALAALTL